MEPQIRYCSTSDGVRIGYWSIGSGEPFIDAGHPPTHCEMEWQLAPIRRWYERFASAHQFVRFDTRGSGLSERDISAYSVETIVRDIDGVADALRFDRFILMGAINSSAAAISYAAQHPDRVSRLLLWCPYSRGLEFFDDSGTRALRDMVDRDWHMLTETATRSRFSWAADDHAREYSRLWRAAVTPRVQAMLMDSLATLDVTDRLGEVRVPTLILQRHDRGPDVAQRIADGIPDARVVLLPGGSAAPYLEDADEVWSAIARFTGASHQPASATGTAIILFTDIADSTTLTERLGDSAFRTHARTLDHELRRAITANGGTPIEGKLLGDGVLATFPAASQAIAAALACNAACNGTPLQLHLGIHAGDVIRERDNVFGGAVNIAARVCAISEPGEILVSATVRDLARTSSGVQFEARGEQVMKGVGEPVRVYAVRAQL
jgi:class 3 adenylate cyclase